MEIVSQPARPNPVDVQVAIEDATEELRARVEALETELKKSQKEISTAQKEKSEISVNCTTSAELEHAKRNWTKHPRPKEVRDQLAAAQESLQVIQSSGSGGQKAAPRSKVDYALKKALEAAEAGRSAAEKETGESNRN